jgi:hypothetical protein
MPAGQGNTPCPETGFTLISTWDEVQEEDIGPRWDRTGVLFV